MFKQEASNGRSRSSQLQELLHEKSTELEAVRAQLAAAQEDSTAAAAAQQHLQQQLHTAQRSNLALAQQCDKVGIGRAVQANS